jgi:hypothetical protein
VWALALGVRGAPARGWRLGVGGVPLGYRVCADLRVSSHRGTRLLPQGVYPRPPAQDRLVMRAPHRVRVMKF